MLSRFKAKRKQGSTAEKDGVSNAIASTSDGFSSQNSAAASSQAPLDVISDQGPTAKSPVVGKRGPEYHAKEGLLRVCDFQAAVGLMNKVDIVAIHGLNGDPWRTWTENGVIWFADLLPKHLPEFDLRVSTFGYNSKLFFGDSVLQIRDYAVQLLGSLHHRRRESGTEKIPIVFICHSLGGIVLKKLLIIAHEQQKKYDDIKTSTKVAVFFGTPHTGSGVAGLSRVLGNVVNFCAPHSTRVDLLKNLERNSVQLEEIAEQFIERASELKILSVYEGRPLSSILPIIVDKSSAILKVSHERIIPIDADHRTICRFSDPEDPAYRTILLAISTMIKDCVALEDDELKVCIDSLYFESYKERRTKVFDPHADTFIWIWNHPMYKKFENGRNSCLLWVQGKPGSGKSTLANYVRARACDFIDRRSQQSIVVDFFYSSRGGDLQNGHYWMLRSLLYQFLVKAPGLWVGYLNDFKECHRGGRSSERQDGPDGTDIFSEFSEPSSTHVWTMDRLKALFRSLGSVHEPNMRLIAYVIIDALDESEEDQRQDMIEMFRNAAWKDPSWPITFKIFLTSRPSPKIERALRNCHTLVLEDETPGDVTSYVNSETRRISKNVLQCEYKDLNYISSYLIHEAQGVFLWVRLVLIELDDRATEGFCNVAELEALLRSIPKNLEELYVRILNKIKNGSTVAVRECQTVLRWIAYSPRPLLTDEMRDILAASACGNTILSVAELQRRRVGNTEDLKRRLISLCGNLVEVKEGTAQFIHTTVREYLLEEAISETISLKRPDSLLEIGVLCAKYVAGFKTSIQSIIFIPRNEGQVDEEDIKLCIKHIDQYVLLPHIFGCQIDYINALDEEMRKERLSSTLTDAMASACTALQPAVIESILQGNLHSLGRLILYADQINALYLLPRHDPRLDYGLDSLPAFPEEERQVTLLQMISLLKTDSKVSILSLLLKRGADPNCRDNSGQTSLHYAVEAGTRAYDLLVKIVEERAEPTIQDAFQAHTPLLRFCCTIDNEHIKTAVKSVIRASTGVFIAIAYGDSFMTKKDLKLETPLRSLLEPAIKSRDRALWATVRVLISAHREICRLFFHSFDSRLVDSKFHGPFPKSPNIIELFCEKEGDEALRAAVLTVTSAHAVLYRLLDSGADSMINDTTAKIGPLDLALQSNDRILTHLLLESWSKTRELDPALAKTNSQKLRLREQTLLPLAKQIYVESYRGSIHVISWLHGHEFDNFQPSMIWRDFDLYKDSQGRTAFHIAAMKGFVNVVHSMALFGFDSTERDAHGDSALDVAVKNKREKVKIRILIHEAMRKTVVVPDSGRARQFFLAF